MELIAKLSRASIADRLFVAGDGILLPNILVSLGENERSSTCQFSIYDPGLLIGAEFQRISILQGGILVPDELIKDPKEEKPSPNSASSADKGTLQSSGGGNKEENIKLIIAECLKQGVTNKYQICYVLATAEHESGFEPISEYGGESASYAPYYGRGFVQLTWKDNYAKYSKILGQDFVSNPEAIKQPTVAAFILVHGMKTGAFTTVGLGDFISDTKKNYVGARAIVNGTDRADYIAGLAIAWEKKIDAYLNNSPLKPVIDSGSNVPTTVNQGTQTTESSIKGTEIIIELGFGFEKRLINFHFLHVATESTRDGTDITTFSGQSVRWVLSRVPLTTSFQSVTLKQITELYANAYGLSVDMKTDGLNYAHLDQTSLTPFQLLQREYKKIGYKVVDKGSRLIVEPEATPHFSNFIIDQYNLIKIKFTDKARGSKPIPYQAISDPYTQSNSQKFAIEPKSGKVTQILPQSLKGVPKSDSDPSPGLTTGGSANPISGIREITLDPNITHIDFPDSQDPNNSKTSKVEQVTTTKDDGTSETKDVTTETTKSKGKIVTVKKSVVNGTTEETTVTKEIVFDGDMPKSQKTTTVKAGSTVTTTKSVIDKDLLATLINKPSQDLGNNYGLPTQEPGIIALEKGKVEAQVISDEAKRIRGYECYATLVTNMDVLQILPGEIVGISANIFPDPFNREWRVYTVDHNWQQGSTDIVIYTPQGLMEDKTVDSNTLASVNPDTSTISDSDFRSPMPAQGNSVAGISGEFGYARGRLHKGIDIGGNGSGNDPDAVYASHNGIVTFAGVASGYGNRIELTKPDKWMTAYNHLASFEPFIKEGATVTIGQKIATRGNTGGAYPIHLHFEVFNPNGTAVDPRTKVPNLPARV